MDFLDPRRRRSHRRRLFIGYILMSIVIAIGTMTILYLAYGYDIDRKTGDLIQNGIVFVDSKPNGANLFLNDIQQGSRTATRMVLPAGTYTIRIERDGYRHWQRTFNLEGGQIQRLVYPLLIPNNFTTTDINLYDALPTLATQSPDRRWVLLQKPGQTYQFDVYDLANPAQVPAVITLPLNLLTNPSQASVLEAIEWSNSNRHLLLKRTFGQSVEFMLFDRENPQESLNINKTLGINPALISLKDKKQDQLYFLDTVPGSLRSADLKNRTISAPLALGVLDYKSYADNIVIYATQENAEAGRTDFRVLENDRTFILKSVSQSEKYVMDVARYDNEWYYVAGGSADNMAFVYENPLPALKKETKTPLIVAAILRLDNPQFVSFSSNTQFIGLQSGNNILSLDLEDRHQYRYTLNHEIPLSTKLKWMDGHRYFYVVNNQSYMVDFDGSNEQTLVTMKVPIEPFFDRDYDNIFTLEDSKQDRSKSAMTQTKIDPL
jgi:hypothetical protein